MPLIASRVFVVLTAIILCSCNNRTGVMFDLPTSPAASYQDFNPTMQELKMAGFEYELERLPAHLEGNAKNEISIASPGIMKFSSVGFILSPGLYISNEVGITIGWHKYNDKYRTIIDVSDAELEHAILYVIYQDPENLDRGKRFVVQLQDLAKEFSGKN